ncbi:S53 family peptidase [Streptomyces sp. NPDC054804]
MVTTVLGLTAALLVTPPARADAPPDARGIRLTAAAIEKLSKRYQTRIDGTPGQVAAQQGPAAAAPAPQGTAPSLKAGSENRTDATPTAPGLKRTGQWETARGFAEGVALGGTKDWVGVFSGSTVARYDAQGKQVWGRGATSLYKDWQVTPDNWFQPYGYLPNLYVGYNPYQMSASGKHPYVTSDFNGDGVDDVAVAYVVGDWPGRPFSSPGSQLHYGTFVTVLDGRTGKAVWHKLVPGSVGTMLVQDGKLIVADSTGPDWGANPVAEQGDSRSNLTAYSFRAAHGKLAGTADWTYSTHAPWARWGDLTSLGGGRIAASWSDTPMGLGNPRPAAGNVLVLKTSDGTVASHAKTHGYPRMLFKDPGADRVLVIEQNDPFDEVRWDLTAIDAHSGDRRVLASREGTVPEAFQVLPNAHGGQPRFAVAELGVDADLSDGQNTISGWDGQGHTLWSYTTASTVGGPNAPTMELSSDAKGSEVFASLSDPTKDTAATPAGPEHTQLLGLNAASGHLDWRQEGALSGDTLTRYRGGLLTVGYDDTAYTVDPGSGKAQAMPLAGDLYAAVATDVNGDGTKDLITGGQSRGVFALDGKTLKKPTPTVLWRATVDSSVHVLRLLPNPGKDTAGDSVVAATDQGFAVLSTHTGDVRAHVHTGGFVASLTVVGNGHNGSEIVVPGSSLTAYTAQGKKLWTYRPKGTEGKSLFFSSVTTDDAGHLFFEYGGTHKGGLPREVTDPAPTAVRLDAATGTPVWTETPTGSGAVAIVPTNPALADPNIPGADGHGVAFAYTGDFTTYHHLVQILDSRTGAVLKTYDSPGMSQGFVASKKTGLVEMREFNDMVYPADGSEPYDVPTFFGFHSGVFAKSVGGTEAFVGAYQALWSYDTPFADNDGFLRESAVDSALGASQVQTAELGDGPGDDMIGLALDWRALRISASAIGDGVNDIDYFPHGLTTYQLSEDEPTRIPTPPGGGTSVAAPSAAARADQPDDTGPRSASPLKELDMPIGTASVPIEIRSKAAAAKQLSVGRDNTSEVTRGYTPQQIQARLGLKGDGTGQTIAIVDAYHYPTAKQDLNHFSAHFDLPQTCDTASAGADCFDFQQVYADGTQPDVDTGWNEEAALDIEWAHSVAPHAKIVLVEGTDPTMAALYRADDVAAALHPAAVSNSWGSGEFSEEAFYDGHCKLADSVCVQSTGDSGYPSGYSATNPYVLAIGGTNLRLDADGNTTGETAWKSTGGGLSYFEPRPAYQDGVQSSPLRATPDVSFVADPTTGVPVYMTMTVGDTTRSVWFEVGGTSLSAPIWGAIIASADQLRAAAGKPHLASDGPEGDTAHTDVYALDSTSLRDITSGSNGPCGAECTAGPGYDTVTGLGSPIAGVDAALAALR